MVNISGDSQPAGLDRVAQLVGVYVVVALATLATLAVLSGIDTSEATAHAWGHALIVGVFAVLLPVRLHSARHGSERALLAVGIIATVLVLVNLVEALIPGFLPTWMRIEMIGLAVLMALVSVLVLPGQRYRQK